MYLLPQGKKILVDGNVLLWLSQFIEVPKIPGDTLDME